MKGGIAMMDFGAATMTKAEVDAFLGADFKANEEGLKAAVASLRKDGSPFVVPLGFWYDGEYLYVTMSPTRGGVQRLRRDPRVSVTVFQHASPAKFVTIAGRAEEIPDPGDEISRKIYHRYPRPDSYRPEFEENWLATGKVVFRVPMTDWVGMDLSKVPDITEYAQTPADKALLARRAAEKG